MRLAHPELLVLVWSLPVLFTLLLLGGRRSRKKLAALMDVRHVPRVTTHFRPYLRSWVLWLQAAALCLVFFAALQPQWGFRWITPRDRGSDLMVVVDVSDSMRATDLSPNRLERARREIVDLIRVLQGERIGLIAFAGKSHLLCPLTHDTDAFTLFLDYLDTDLIPVQGTDIGGALIRALATFDKQSSRVRNILLITDGEDHQASLAEAAKAAKAADVKIFVVGIGSDDGAPIPNLSGGGFRRDKNGNLILTKLAETPLRDLAAATQGRYARSVAGDMDLQAIYREGIALKFNDGTLKEQRRKQHSERYQLFLLVGLLLWGTALWLPLKRGGAAVGLVAFFLLGTPGGTLTAGPLREGMQRYASGDFAGALERFTAGQVDRSEDPQVDYNIGNTLYRLKKYPEAADAYLRALQKTETQPKNGKDTDGLNRRSRFNLGNALFQQQQYADAVKQYEALLKTQPDDQDAKHNLELAKRLLKQQNMQKQPKPSQQDRGDEQKDQPPSPSPQQDDQQQNNPNQPNAPKPADPSDNPQDQGEPSPRKRPQPDPQQNHSEQQAMSQQEAQRWLSAVEEEGGDLLKRMLRRKMWKQQQPEKDW